MRLIDASRPAIDTAEDPQYMKERIAAADMYADLFNVSLENAFLNLEHFHQQWMGQDFVKKTGIKALGDSVKLSFLTMEYNELNKKLAKSKNQDPNLLKAVEQYEQKLDQLRDRAPKVWQDDYVKMGGWQDVGQFLRGVGVSMGENAVQIGGGVLAAAAAATGVGLIGGAVGLSAGTAGLLTAGASRAAIMANTYNSTWGIKYREMTSAGIPHDIAINFAQSDAMIEGIIEGALGGVEAAGANAISRAVVPQAVGRATNRLFISGKMGTAAKRVLAALKEGTEEGTEEVLQAFSSGRMFNMAADNANAVREEKLRQIVNPLFADMREELEKELENHPEVDRKEWNEILDEAWDGGIAGFLTGLVLGIPIEITNYRHDVRAAQQLAEMAQAAPNEAVFKDMVENAKEHGFRLPVEGLKTDEETALLSDIYKVQQERLTPEQRAEKAKQAQDAEALAEVTDYRNTETVQRTEEYEDETGKKNQETITELARPNEKVYKENGKLEIEEYTDTNEDGSINGSFVAGDPRIDDDEDQSGANQYGYINYTKNGDTITIDEFKMVSGYENLRGDLWSQFTEKFGNVNYVWNPKHEQNIAIRDELIKNNPDGPKNGLNYNINNVSTEARQVAQRFQPYLKNSTPLETALAAELFNNFYRRRGESLNGAMHRLIGSVTNEASPDVIAAQREGKLIKGAIWFDKTAEGMKRIVYLNKNAADISTVIHETSHAVANDFTEAERNIAARALNGYKLKNGTTVYFEENGRQWTDEQHEAFAEAFENYLTNGTAPNEQIKTLFEKIKEFMKRIYQTMKGWTELSPKVEEFYKSLLSGELVDQARAETAAQIREESRREAQTEKTQNDTKQTENATKTPQDTNRAISPNATQSHTEAQQQRDQIINDPDIPLEEKTQAVFDAAGDALYQAGEYNPDENPIDYLKANGQRLTDTAERKRVIAEIEELAHLYPPETNRYLAPNGKASNLNHAQWYAVRTPSFKEWFGEWERAARIAQFEHSPNIALDGNAYKDKYELNKESILDYLENTLRKETMSNPAINADIRLAGAGIDKIIGWGMKNETYKKLFAHIPEFTQKAIFLAEENPNKPNAPYKKYTHLACGIEIDGKPHTVHIVLGENQGQWYYSHILLDIEKGSLLAGIRQSTPGHPIQASLPDIKDTTLLRLLQADSSKIVDENGEPLPVFHGTGAQFEIFDISKARQNADIPAFFFSNDYTEASEYGDVNSYFLNIRNPKTDKPVVNMQGLAVRKELEKQGFDGAITDEDGIVEYAAFEPNQIKSATDNAGTFNPNNPSILFQTAEANEQFNGELDQFLEGKLEKGHIFKLGEPGGILQRAGFPAGQEIELSATRLEEKSKAKHHPFNPADLKNLVQSINEPVAVFAYGDRINAQNVIIEIRQNGKNYLVGIHFDQQRQGTFVSSIRGLFPKETVNWLNWINQGLLLYADIGKLQAVVAQQRTNPADVSNHNLEPIERLIRENAGVKDYFPNENVTLFQFGDREMLEEAADFEDGKAYRKYFVENYGMPEEIEWDWTEEEINAWFNEFVKKAKQAVKSSGQIETGAETGEKTEGKELTPAEKDKDFKEIISAPGELENFAETAVQMHNEDYSQWGAEEGSEEAEFRDRQVETSQEIRKMLAHPTWQTIILNKGKISTSKQRKKLLTMIKNEPRTYRKLYAQVMEREDLTVSPEDMTAEILKNKIHDPRRKEEVDSLTPEKLRQLAEQLDIEDFAEKVRTGRAQYNDPIEKAFIKQLQEQRQKVEEELKEAEEDRQEDNNYIERQAGKEFNEKWEKVLKAREYLTKENKNLEKAIKNGERDAARIAMRLQRNKANYDSLVQDLQALARVQQLELDIQEILAVETLRDYKKSAKAQATLQKHLAVESARAKWEARLAELKEQRETLKALNKKKVGAVRRTLRSITPQQVNAEQGIAVAAIQKFAEPSMLEGLDRTIDEYNKPDLRDFFGRWKTDEKLRSEILNDKKNRHKVTQEKITSLFNKEKFEDLTDKERQYLYNKLPPNNTVIGLKGRSIRRDNNYPNINEETAKQIASKYLPPDVYQRIIDKPYSEWTLTEAEELAKIVDDLTVEGKNLYKANIDAERKRIQAYRTDVMKTIRTVVKKGKVLNDSDEVEKILGKYKEGENGSLIHYADMNIYRYARMLDNGRTDGKNMAALCRGARDAHNQELAMMNFRAKKVYDIMKEQKITEKDLWQKAFELDLGGDIGNKEFTAAEVLGFTYASQNDYSRDAIIGGNLLTEYERGEYQIDGITPEEVTPLMLIAQDRFVRVTEAAQKYLVDNPKLQILMNAIGEDFIMSGKRVSEFLTLYNNNNMREEKNYFPIIRLLAVSAQSAGAELRLDLMGSSAGAFNVFVERGFTKERQEIPIQYQTAIKLDIMGVWTEAMERQEHFISHGQLVKDLNQIYKNSRPVRNTIERRYGKDAVKYIDKFINELANPKQEATRSTMDKFVRSMRGNTAAAYLGWKVSSIVKQAITSPAPFFAYMNPLEYYKTQIEYAAHHEALWKEILELSPYMGSRSASLMIDLIKEKAQQRSDNKAVNALNDFNKMGMKGLEWIDRSCVAPGWLVLFRKEHKRLTADPSNANMSEKDLKVKAAQYADDITSLTQPSSWHGDLPQLFKGNSEFAKAFLQFTQSLSMIWQNIRYDMPQMIRDKQYRQAAGTIIGYAVAGIMLGAITQWFDDDDDDEMKAKKLAWWATTQFTDAFPVLGSEITRLTEQAFTGEKHWQGGVRNLFPVLEKGYNAISTGITAAQEKDFDESLKASAQLFEAVAILNGLPTSGFKEGKRITGIGSDEGPNPLAAAGRY